MTNDKKPYIPKQCEQIIRYSILLLLLLLLLLLNAIKLSLGGSSPYTSVRVNKTNKNKYT